MLIKRSSWVLLYFKENRFYLARAGEGKLNTNEGIIDLDSLVNKSYGIKGKTHLGLEYIVSKPDLITLFKIFKRKTQVVYPKDIGTIVLLADICPGSLVVEAGTGSGFLTAILANFVKPSGKVFTYEVRREFQEVAIKNLTMVGLERYVEFKLKDIRKGIDEKEVDAVILDMPDPWNVADIAFSSLRSGGKIVCFLPTINQVERVVETLKERGFIMIEVREILERTYKVKRGETRPEVFMIGHTGYIVSGGKP